MAGVKISALPAVASALLTDIFPVVQAGVTSQESVQQLANLLGYSGGILSMAQGGTGAALTPANGAIPYSSVSAFALLAPGTSGQLLQSGGAGAPNWTTTIYPTTNAINTLLYASALNVMSALATANSSVLVTSAGGAPSLSTVLPGGLTTTDPTLTQGIATKNYVDQTALNGTTVYAASAATLGTVTQAGAGPGATLTNAGAQATFLLDGVNPPVGSNVLIKNTATGMAAQNEGIYTVTNVGSGATNWVLTRATSYDSPTEINNTGLIVVQNGSTLVGTAWYNAATIVTVDTTAFSYSQFGNVIFPITLAQGGTGAALVASNGGIFYSNASTGAILAGTATAQQLLMSGASTIPTWSTSTYPLANAVNTLLYASSANVMAALSTANSSVLVTSGAGVPSLSTTLPSGISATGMKLTTPQIITSINDSNNNAILGISPTASSVNNFQIKNAATGNQPTLSAVGSDANISGTLLGKGTGGFNIQGFGDGSTAASGNVGYYTSANLQSGSAITLMATTSTNILTLSLPAGDFDINGNLDFQPTGIIETLDGWLSTASATIPDPSLIVRQVTAASATGVGFCVPMLRVTSASPFNVYLSAFSTSTPKVSGTIQARCIR